MQILMLSIFLTGLICLTSFSFYLHGKRYIENKELKERDKKLKQQIAEEEQAISQLLNAERQLAARQLETGNLLIAFESKQREEIMRKLDKEREAKQKELQEWIKSYNEELSSMQESTAKSFLSKAKEQEEQLKELEEIISSKKNQIHAINQDNLRKAKEESERDFYRIVLNPMNWSDLEKLLSIVPLLANPEVINKVIWKMYYEKPSNEMIDRVLGTDKTIVGIYKITDLISNKIYVGQSVDIANRFKQHIKRGLGAEPATKSKLYEAMKQDGMQNFTFELLEECSRDLLDKKEKQWIEYYESNLYGLNGTGGNNT